MVTETVPNFPFNLEIYSQQVLNWLHFPSTPSPEGAFSAAKGQSGESRRPAKPPLESILRVHELLTPGHAGNQLPIDKFILTREEEKAKSRMRQVSGAPCQKPAYVKKVALNCLTS